MKFQVLMKRTTVRTHIPCIQDIALWVGITKTLSFPTLCCEGTRGRERQVAITPTNSTKNLMPTHLGRIQRGKHHKLHWGGGKKSQTNQKSERHHLVMGNRDQHVLVQGDRSSIFLVIPIRWPTLTGELETSRQQNANTWDDWLPVKLNRNWSQGLTALCGW